MKEFNNTINDYKELFETKKTDKKEDKTDKTDKKENKDAKENVLTDHINNISAYSDIKPVEKGKSFASDDDKKKNLDIITSLKPLEEALKDSIDSFLETQHKERYEAYKKELNGHITANDALNSKLVQYFSKELSDTLMEQLKENIRVSSKLAKKQLVEVDAMFKKIKLEELGKLNTELQSIKGKLEGTPTSSEKQSNISKLESIKSKFKTILTAFTGLKELDEQRDNKSYAEYIKDIEQILNNVKDKVKTKSKSPFAKVAGTSEFTDENGTRQIADNTSKYNILWDKYINEIKDGNKIMEEIEDDMYTKYKANNLDPEKALALSSDDKIIFVVIIFIIRQISLSIAELFIDYDMVTTLYFALIVYAIFYVLIIAIIILVVNFDEYKMRIVFNYFNMHINPSGISSHIILVVSLMAMMYILIYNIYKDIDYKKEKITEIEKMRLVYKLELMTIFIYVMVAGITLLT